LHLDVFEQPEQILSFEQTGSTIFKNAVKKSNDAAFAEMGKLKGSARIRR